MTDIIQTGQRAKALLESRALKEAIEDTRDALFSRWESAGDVATRETIYAELQGMKRIIKQLGISAERGKLAEIAATPKPKTDS